MVKLVKLFLCRFAWARELYIHCFLFQPGQKNKLDKCKECREFLKPAYCANREIT